MFTGSGDGDPHVFRCIPGSASVFIHIAFEQHRAHSTLESGGMGPLFLQAELRQDLVALLAHRNGHHVIDPQRRRLGALTVGEDMQVTRRHFQQEIAGSVEFGVSLSRKAHDHVDADARLGHAIHDVGKPIAVEVGPVTPAHGRQHSITSTLQGNVKMRLEFGGCRYKVNQGRIEEVGFNGTDAVPLDFRQCGVRFECPAEVEQGFTLRLAEVPDVDSRQNDFPGACLSGLPRFDKRGIDVRTPRTPPGQRDGAEGTEIIAAILDLEEAPGPVS